MVSIVIRIQPKSIVIFTKRSINSFIYIIMELDREETMRSQITYSETVSSPKANERIKLAPPNNIVALRKLSHGLCNIGFSHYP